MWEYFWKDFVMLVMGFFALVFLVIAVVNLTPLPQLEVKQIVTVKYDCSLAEISPDYPVAVKEACRERMKK